MEEAAYVIIEAVVKGKINDYFVGKYKDTLLSFRTPEVGNNIVHIAVRHQTLKVIEEVVILRPELLRQKNNHGSTPLHEAAAFGDKETVELLISLLRKSSSSSSSSTISATYTITGAYLLDENQDGETPFHVALRSRNMAAAQELFLRVMNYHPEILAMKTDLHKETPLHLYVRYCTDEHFSSQINGMNDKIDPNNQALIRELIKANVKGIFEADSEGLCPLKRAAQHGRVLLIYWMLLEFPLQLLEWRDSKGKGFLHHLRLNTTENLTDKDYTLNVCKLILEFPGIADILASSRDQDGRTPMHLAILDRDFDLAQLILARHVDILESTEKLTLSIKNILGKQVYDLITTGPDIPHVFKYLMERASWRGVLCKRDELYDAAINLDVKYLRCQLPHESGDGYPNSQVDKEGRNVLHIVLQHHHKSFSPYKFNYAKYKSFIEEAVQLKAFPKLILQKDRDGDTPLHIAARLSSEATTIFLEMTFRKWRILQSSANDDDYATINLIPRPWMVKDSRGLTPLQEAAGAGNIYGLQAMLLCIHERYQKEAVSVVNEFGETISHLIARSFEDPYHVEKVLRGVMEIDFGIRDVDGLTPILRAAHCGRAKIVKVFSRAHSQSFKKSDYKGRNVLHHLCTSTLTNGDELTELLEYWDNDVSVLGVKNFILSQDDDGNTPLHLAITVGQNFEVAEHLIRHCANCAQVKNQYFIEALMNRENKEGKSIKNLITTCESDVPASLKEVLDEAELPDRDPMDDDLYVAAKDGNVGFVDSLSPHRLHCICYDRGNIFHVALRYQQLSLVKHVLREETLMMFIYWKDSKGDTALHVSAGLPPKKALSLLEHCLATCEEFHPHGKPWKEKNRKGNTYLHEAARLCNYEVIFSQLLYGKDIQDVNQYGETVLHVFAKYATNAAKEFLKNISVQMQSLIYIQDFEGFTPVLRALQYGRLGVATLLIRQCPHVVEIPDNKGGTVLHYLRALVVDRVDDGTDIFPVWDVFFRVGNIDHLRNAQNADGNTALHLAIIDGDIKKTKFLMEKCLLSPNKKELDIVNHDGHSVFDLIVLKAAKIPAMKELLPLVSRNYIKERELMDRVMDDELYQAAIDGDDRIFEPAADDSAMDDAESRPPTRTIHYFRSQTPSGSNIVHIALRHENANVETFINTALRYHPILSILPDNNGDTPLHLAAKWKSRVAIVNSLISAAQEFLQDHSNRAYHAFPWAVKNYKGSFPIHEALQSDNLEAADALLICDTDAANRVNDLGDTPLHSLAKNGFSISYDDANNFVQKLLARSTRAAYLRDDEGLTPLLCAARSSRLQVARAILQHRPQSAYIQDLCGRTFLHLLRFTGEDADESLDVTKFKKTGKQLFKFPEVDAQRLVQDFDGNTPLHYAIINGNSIAAIVLTYRCVEDEEQRELGLLNKKGQTISDLLALDEVPNEIIEQIKKKVPTAVYLARSSYGIRKTEMKYSANALSVVAALLATITFAAGLQVPGGFNQDEGFPVLLIKPAFGVFITANTIAMCCSMLCLFLLLWVMGIGKIHGSLKVLDISIILIQLSFYLALLAFTMGVFVTTAAKSLRLGILVIVLGALTFILTFKIPFITVAQCGVRVTKSIKKFFKFLKFKCKRQGTNHTNVTVNQTPRQDRTSIVT